MKKSISQANMTVITIVLIGIVAAIGLALIPKLNSNTKTKACCTNAGGEWTKDGCKSVSGIIFENSQYEKCTAE